ncbi:hypothetical protein KR222_004839 [Zaprionus bogoriensis]|nr:hypothetical protein KR222_004839 [Zaprionus bogoriensis]
MHCTTRVLRYVLCVVNVIYALNGCLLIWYGVWLLDSLSEQQNAVEHGEKLAAILCLLLGSVIILASIFGTVALFKECRKMLISYAVLLLLLLVIQFIMFSISFAASRDALPESLRQGFDELWDAQHGGNNTLAAYEEWLQCCGRNSAEDYLLLERELPLSCCAERDCTHPMNLHVEGCESKFKQYVSRKTANFHTISWLLMLSELVGSVVTCYLVDSIRNHRERVRFFN